MVSGWVGTVCGWPMGRCVNGTVNGCMNLLEYVPHTLWCTDRPLHGWMDRQSHGRKGITDRGSEYSENEHSREWKFPGQFALEVKHVRCKIPGSYWNLYIWEWIGLGTKTWTELNVQSLLQCLIQARHCKLSDTECVWFSIIQHDKWKTSMENWRILNWDVENELVNSES